jgi:T5SS/PEP-CTERM-associated repeat protein
MEVGDNPGSTGTVIVDGTNSLLFLGLEDGTTKKGSIKVGDAGNGNLIVTNAAQVRGRFFTIGRNNYTFDSTSVVVVADAGSLVETEQIWLGQARAKGVVTIRDGGRLTSGLMKLGHNAGTGGGATGDGILTVGSNALVEISFSGTNSFEAGQADYAEMNLGGGGRITVQKNALIFSNTVFNVALGYNSTFHSDQDVYIQDGTTIGVTELGASYTEGTWADVATASNLVSATPANLNLDLSALDPSASGELQVTTSGGRDRLQVKVALSNDEDNDGIPNDWETTYFGCSTCAVASADGDGDGANNLEEYIADTIPTNSASVLSITNIMVVATNDITVYWKGGTNATQYLQRADGVAGMWTDLKTNVPPTAGQDSYTDTGVTPANEQKLYQIKVTR